MDNDKKLPKQSGSRAEPEPAGETHIDQLFRSLQSELHRPKPGPEAIAAAVEVSQRLAAEAEAERSADSLIKELGVKAVAGVCRACGYRNRPDSRFCGMCGAATSEAEAGESGLEERHPQSRGATLETHHYHHHYHHHYLPGGYEGTGPRPAADFAREEKLRPSAALRGDMSRAEAAVRRITHEWVLASNTKHLDDLLDLYVTDALVLRSNFPPVRGAAAIREFFFGALDAGFGEVEVEPLRVEVAGDLAYEAGRCKALVPSATGKRREERGKYLWVFARQSNGEWKLAADCWSSDLSLTVLESDVPPSAGVRTREPRRGS